MNLGGGLRIVYTLRGSDVTLGNCKDDTKLQCMYIGYCNRETVNLQRRNFFFFFFFFFGVNVICSTTLNVFKMR